MTKHVLYFFDISKAVDKVWHEVAIYKLKYNGIFGSLLNFLKIICQIDISV